MALKISYVKEVLERNNQNIMSSYWSNFLKRIQNDYTGLVEDDCKKNFEANKSYAENSKLITKKFNILVDHDFLKSKLETLYNIKVGRRYGV
jgi:hypothetical protein